MKLRAHGSSLDLRYPQIMGIINVTPDSFSDGGHYNTLPAALQHASEMINAGATIIDVGGESTRPGAQPVSVQHELDRVIPLIQALAARFEIWISVDTSQPQVMQAAAAAGAHLINDIRALSQPGALEMAVQLGLPVCLMHMQGEPHTMQQQPHYQNVVTEIKTYFRQQLARCQAAGIPSQQLIIDPGFGFGKNLCHNYQLLAKLAEFHQLGVPLLVGMSRKSMVGQLLNVPPNQRLAGSLACAVIAAMQGAQIIRVHDVKPTVDAIRVVEATLSAKNSKDNQHHEQT